MCGIAGWIVASGHRGPDQLQAMADLIAHRGPDDRGTFVDREQGVALAHNRLSIIDLSSAGHQPMPNEDGSLQLTFNGEIYNFADLRAELVAHGHVFRSRTDSEVLVHGYEQWGEGVLDRLCGMFAFAIWDSNRRRLFLARDQMGVKPLYYWFDGGGGFHFASELKAFLALDGFQPQLNPRALRQFLELNFVCDTSETSLVGVLKVPAAHALMVSVDDIAAKRRPSPRRYFTSPPVEPPTGEDGEPDGRADQLFCVLDRVVREQLVADVPVGLLLSGGLDSSVIAAIAARHGRVRTISMGFADSAVDERPFARAVSDHIGSELRLVRG
jgi:asparagine synthase (glutamine-hydrolysing)